jgi:hypothetical protein
MRKTLLIAATVALVTALPAASAVAGHWWFATPGGPAVVHVAHVHAPSLSLFNQNGPSWTAMEHARGEWSGSSWALDIHNWANGGAQLVSWDGNWGNTGWRGLTTLYGAWDGQHIQQMGIQLNLSALPDYANMRKTACHELGHAAAGLDHYAENGCMMSGTPTTDAQQHPSAHDVEHADTLWGVLH